MVTTFIQVHVLYYTTGVPRLNVHKTSDLKKKSLQVSIYYYYYINKQFRFFIYTFTGTTGASRLNVHQTLD
jgi:hypothetical protein